MDRERTRSYSEIKQAEDIDDFEEMVLEMVEIHNENKMLLTQKKLDAPCDPRSLLRRSTKFTLSRSSLQH